MILVKWTPSNSGNNQTLTYTDNVAGNIPSDADLSTPNPLAGGINQVSLNTPVENLRYAFIVQTTDTSGNIKVAPYSIEAVKFGDKTNITATTGPNQIIATTNGLNSIEKIEYQVFSSTDSSFTNLTLVDSGEITVPTQTSYDQIGSTVLHNPVDIGFFQVMYRYKLTVNSQEEFSSDGKHFGEWFTKNLVAADFVPA